MTIEQKNEEAKADKTKSADAKVTKKVAKKVTKKVAKKVTKKVAKKVTKKATKKVTKKATKKVTKKATKKVTKKAAEMVADDGIVKTAEETLKAIEETEKVVEEASSEPVEKVVEDLKLQEQKNNPLHGVKLERLLTELVEFYGFPILGEQININCFQSNPSIKSSLKFLRRTLWARNKVEAFYLYKYKQLPLPDENAHQLEPRIRPISLDQKTSEPAKIVSGDSEFFDDPNTGPAFPSKAKVEKTRSESKAANRKPQQPKVDDTITDAPKAESSNTSGSFDPWGKAREKLGE